MPVGVTPSEVIAVGEVVTKLLHTGLKASMVGYAAFAYVQAVRTALGWERLDPDIFKRIWEMLFFTLFDPVASKVGGLDRRPKMTEVLLFTSFGAVVVAFTVLVEVLGLTLTTGLVYANYYLGGGTVEVLPLYRTIVGMAVVLAISFMWYANRHIRETRHYV